MSRFPDMRIMALYRFPVIKLMFMAIATLPETVLMTSSRSLLTFLAAM